MTLHRVFCSFAAVLALALVSLSVSACSTMDGSTPSYGTSTSKGSGSGGY
ncbi:hypothetical protein WKR88_00430 [Trinickia caryophylli]|uniref:Lipoprotein n=1 Tax=Trinickia caryophylli TaxID=28094 RepID=A0A1X7D1G6_TRICW|nr:hypothetical protein [Trinickia caryophylli]WQE15127.1 hypothetical protein U0034_21500 [Trinickia caryophylli]SMF06913.1 hypothetical protein SAMN06295900_102259 [Trinickia caryophylli]